MKKGTMVILVAIFLLVFITLLYFSKAMPVVRNFEKSQIIRIRYNTGDELIELNNYNDDEVLKYLSTCEERRTLSIAGSYSNDDAIIDIILFTERKLKHILLGNINYSYEGAGTFKHEIVNAQEVKKQLQLILINES